MLTAVDIANLSMFYNIQLELKDDRHYKILSNKSMKKMDALRLAKMYHISIKSSSPQWKSRGIIYDSLTSQFITIVGDGRVYPYVWEDAQTGYPWVIAEDCSGWGHDIRREPIPFIEELWFYTIKT